MHAAMKALSVEGAYATTLGDDQVEEGIVDVSVRVGAVLSGLPLTRPTDLPSHEAHGGVVRTIDGVPDHGALGGRRCEFGRQGD